MPPTIIFGDLRNLSASEVHPILTRLGISRIDCAASYDDSEAKLGDENMGASFVLDTKIETDMPLNGTLSPEKIFSSARTSLQRMKVDKLNVLYAHAPDYATPVEEQAKAFDTLHREGVFDSVRSLLLLHPSSTSDRIISSSASRTSKPR